MEDRGLEPVAISPKKTAISEKGGAESGALAAGNGPVDPDLQSIIEQWEDLPEATKDRIAAMLREPDSKGSQR